MGLRDRIKPLVDRLFNEPPKIETLWRGEYPNPFGKVTTRVGLDRQTGRLYYGATGVGTTDPGDRPWAPVDGDFTDARHAAEREAHRNVTSFASTYTEMHGLEHLMADPIKITWRGNPYVEPVWTSDNVVTVVPVVGQNWQTSQWYYRVDSNVGSPVTVWQPIENGGFDEAKTNAEREARNLVQDVRTLAARALGVSAMAETLDKQQFQRQVDRGEEEFQREFESRINTVWTGEWYGNYAWGEIRPVVGKDNGGHYWYGVEDGFSESEVAWTRAESFNDAKDKAYDRMQEPVSFIDEKEGAWEAQQIAEYERRIEDAIEVQWTGEWYETELGDARIHVGQHRDTKEYYAGVSTQNAPQDISWEPAGNTFAEAKQAAGRRLDTYTPAPANREFKASIAKAREWLAENPLGKPQYQDPAQQTLRIPLAQPPTTTDKNPRQRLMLKVEAPKLWHCPPTNGKSLGR